ncbi:MAG: oxygen-dependent coproporphyrinogen oxidase [Pseudomonadota bacterium]|nr:oxygen-dependent coproporphyrinogen oxidase [Pseudomonadota bacterium]
MLTAIQKQTVRTRFAGLQTDLHQRLLQLDKDAQQKTHTWDKDGGSGGGTSLVLRGEVIEKAGVNFSCVAGDAYPRLESEHHGKPYYATGVSSICHPANPHAPIGHMNVRMLEVGDKVWFGGGADLTPYRIYEQDRDEFHQALRQACDSYSPTAYAEYTKWCDEYFFIKHRNTVRGVGGIFFDYLQNDFDTLLAFVCAVAEAYGRVYPQILARRLPLPYDSDDRDGLFYWRGRYVEFNLIYDRGTSFGLKTGGNVEAILVSLPPQVKW